MVLIVTEPITGEDGESNTANGGGVGVNVGGRNNNNVAVGVRGVSRGGSRSDDSGTTTNTVGTGGKRIVQHPDGTTITTSADGTVR